MKIKLEIIVFVYMCLYVQDETWTKYIHTLVYVNLPIRFFIMNFHDTIKSIQYKIIIKK